MSLTEGEELRVNLQIATYKLISALARQECQLQTRYTTPEDRKRLQDEIDEAIQARTAVIGDFDRLPNGW